SERFIPVVEDLLEKAGLTIPRERWYSNLTTRGNTGAASIFIMLAEFLESREIKPGEKIFCFIPESGRISAAFMLIEVQSNTLASENISTTIAPPSDAPQVVPPISAPHDPQTAPDHLRELLTGLANIWHNYRSDVWRSPVINK